MKKNILSVTAIIIMVAVIACKTVKPSFQEPDLVEKDLNFDNTGDLPLIQLPLISVPVMVMDNVDNSKTEILVTVNVENPNVFEIPSPKFSYDYQLNKKSFIRGVIENETTLAPNSVTPIQFRLVVNYADYYRNLSTFTNANTREMGSLLILICDFRIPAFSGEIRRFDVPGAFPIRR
ncbi:LEA type 2 family protein [Treponema sp. R6D11]